MNVLLNTDEDRVRLVLEEPATAGVPGQRVEFDAEFCSSPLCHCRDVRFVERTAAAASAGARPREFVLDPFARRAAEPDQSVATESEQLAREVADAMRVEAWKRLTLSFMDVKARAIAEIDFERERVSFPFEAIEHEGLLVAYREIVPFDREVVVTDGDRELLVDELHCVRADCDCSNAVLVVFEVDRAHQEDVDRPATEVAALQVDHRTGRWADPDTGGPLGGEELAVRRQILAQHPDLLATLARQQAVVRGLYVSAAAAAGHSLPAPSRTIEAAPRIGRNEPCPCGSGKKYKKCCLSSS